VIWLFALLALAVAGSLAGPFEAQAERLNGAGLVVQHEDGRVVYVYVSFSEPEITGTDLLQRSGLDLEIAPFGGLGLAICRLDGEGCPASNCFCQSYSSPARYWRYYRLAPDGSWISVAVGPSARKIHDGDVDGWDWSGGDRPPPFTSLVEIARLNGISLDGTAMPVAAAPLASPLPVGAVASVPSSRPPTEVVRAVQVNPSGEVQTVERHERRRSLVGPVAFGVFVALASAGLAFAAISRRRAS
jgi:hypothetical protein